MRITPTEASLHHELAVMQTRVKDIADELVVLKERHAKLVEAVKALMDWGKDDIMEDDERYNIDWDNVVAALESEVSDGD